MRRLVLGDVHGNIRALLQVLERAKHVASDTIIFVGDVADGWPDTRACIDLLIELEAICLRGNHCDWFDEWANGRTNGLVVPQWFNQGGRATLESYGVPARDKDIWYPISVETNFVPDAHLRYLKQMYPYYTLDNKLFVHGGCGYPYSHPGTQPVMNLIWDRDMWMGLQHGGDVEGCEFDEIYIGHTATNFRGDTDPVQRGRVWNVDQGAGWDGKLTLMDIDTKEYWQSDPAKELYPNVKGRR